MGNEAEAILSWMLEWCFGTEYTGKESSCDHVSFGLNWSVLTDQGAVLGKLILWLMEIDWKANLETDQLEGYVLCIIFMGHIFISPPKL